MKIMTPLLFALLMGAGSTIPLNAVAAECTSSFYCYGNTGNAVVRVVTRPPPIPPPNPRVVQQRRQAQLALRNNRTITPRIAQPAITPTPQRAAPQRAVPQVARPTPRANSSGNACPATQQNHGQLPEPCQHCRPTGKPSSGRVQV